MKLPLWNFVGKKAAAPQPPALERDEAVAQANAYLANTCKGTGDFACPVCRETKALAPFEQRADNDNFVYDLWICGRCHAILNAIHLREAALNGGFIDLQASSSDEFYAVDEAYLANVEKEIGAYGFADDLVVHAPDCPRGVLIDFGAGRGIAAAGAARHFDKVHAVELSLNVINQVHEVMPLREKVFVTDNYLAIEDRFDAIMFIHVLEHLPKMRDIVDYLVDRLNPGGAFFFQVPMLRRDHLVCVHYTFLTEPAVRYLARDLGLEVAGIWFNTDFDFLTCLLRKPF